jgi:ketosteroid isomerase-like protein
VVDESELIAEVLAVEKEWVAAHRTLNVDVLSRILGENYRQIKPDGSVIGKDELLNSYRSGERTWEIGKGEDYEVRILGEVALVIGRWTGRGVNSGQRFDYSARFLAVYQNVEGDWKLVSDVSIPLVNRLVSSCKED